MDSLDLPTATPETLRARATWLRIKADALEMLANEKTRLVLLDGLIEELGQLTKANGEALDRLAKETGEIAAEISQLAGTAA